jgi:hypothetical protein
MITSGGDISSAAADSRSIVDQQELAAEPAFPLRQRIASTTRNDNAQVSANTTWVITIEGHCDERGTAEHNLALADGARSPPRAISFARHRRRSPEDRLRQGLPRSRSRRRFVAAEPAGAFHADGEIDWKDGSMTRFRAGIPILFVCLAAAPAAAQNRTELQLMAELRMVHEEVQRLQANLNAIVEQLKTSNTRIDTQSEDMRKGFANQNVAIGEIRTPGTLSARENRARSTSQRLNGEMKRSATV